MNCICTGFVEGVKLSFQKDALTNDRLYSLFERLKNHLYYEHCSQQINLIHILSVLITQVSFNDVFCLYFGFEFRTIIVLLWIRFSIFYSLILIVLGLFSFVTLVFSTHLELEIAKYIHSFVSSQLDILFPHYETLKNRLLMIFSVEGLPDQVESLLIKAYRLIRF